MKRRRNQKTLNNVITDVQLEARSRFRGAANYLSSICFQVRDGNLRGLDEFNELIKYLPPNTREQLENLMSSSKGTKAAKEALNKGIQGHARIDLLPPRIV